MKLLLATIAIALSSCAEFPLPGDQTGKATLGYFKQSSSIDPDAKLGIFIERVPTLGPLNEK